MGIGSRPAATADDISTNVKALVDRVLEADVTDTIAQRSREIAAAVGEATDAAVDRAGETWRDTAHARRDAIKTMQRASSDAADWGSKAWRKDLRPRVRDLWKRRAVAFGAAGAAIPAGREIAESAAERLGIKQREERHWGAFFLGLVLGAAGGAIVALLTTPKRGTEMRQELAERAQDAATVVTERAQSVAENAGDWVPLFQRDEVGADEISADSAEWPVADEAQVTNGSSVTGDEMTDAVAQEVDEREQP